MPCPKCGVTVSDRARSCVSCGQTIDMDGDMTNTMRIPPGLMNFGNTDGWASADDPIPGLLARIKKIVLTPRTEWPVIGMEPTSIAQVYRGYVMPLAALAASVSFVRMSLIGVHLPFGDMLRTPPLTGLIYAAVGFVIGLCGLFVVGLIIDGFAPLFGGTRDRRQALKTAAYAFTPAWLSTVLGLLPGFAGLLQLAAGFYGIYLLYLGLPHLMGSAPNKTKGYTAAVVISSMVLGIGMSALGGIIGAAGY